MDRELLNLSMDEVVKKWLLELRDVTENECMSVLQGKSLSCKKESDHTAYLVSEIKDVVDLIKTESNAVSVDFETLFRSVESGDWKHLGQHGIQVTHHIRSLIQVCIKCVRDPPVHIVEQQERVMGECAKLAQLVNGFSQGDQLPAKIPLTNQLTYLGQSFSLLVDYILGYLVQKLVELLDEASVPQAVKSAIECFIGLGLDGEHMCYILAREGGVRSLLDICRTDSLAFAHSQALRALATLSCVPETIVEFERENGLELLTELLCDISMSESVQGEAAGVLAQITSPCIEQNQHLGGFVDNIQDLLQALLKIIQKTKSREVFLLAAAATANMTFIDPTACEILHENKAQSILVQQCLLQKAESLFAKDQIATILANMAAVNNCLTGLIDNKVIDLLISFLKESPSLCRNEAELAACERVQQKAAIALTRLCRKETYAQKIIDLEGIPRLVKLCRVTQERNNSDAVLVASLAALRKICSTCGNKNVNEVDLQQLIVPRLMDSFVMCSRSDENFV